MIEIKHLDIQFKQQVIFKNANFKTCPGKITGIIGKRGCGKTTFLKALIYQCFFAFKQRKSLSVNDKL